MNLPDINWKHDSIQGNQVSIPINNRFLEMLQHCGLEQSIRFPTRQDKILDLFLTNRPSLILRSSPLPGISDHDIVLIEARPVAKRNKQIRRKISLWKRANLHKLKEECTTFQERFTQEYNTSSSVEAMWDDIYKNLSRIMENSVPSKMTSSRYNQVWITQEVKKISRRKRKYYKKARETNSREDWDRYKKVKSDAKKACRVAYNNYVHDIISPEISTNPKKFWGFIGSKKSESKGVAPLKAADGLTYSDAKMKADILNNQFSSVFNSNEDNNIQQISGSNNIMENIRITKNGVRKLLANVKIHKATGPDGIPGRLLKELANEITPVYTLLFQASLDQGTIPQAWKQADVVPIFKKGTKSKAANYRPVSLTSITCKLLEHIVTSNIMTHMEKHKILTDTQHGFRRNRSCETQLIITINDIAKSIDNKKQTDIILLDFSKAFDKVPHLRLMKKLHHYGIQGSTHKWITDFLANRSQTVIVEGAKSEIAPVKSGVPQGSVLGPSLFLLYINDLPSYIHKNSSVRLFADDCVLYRTIDNNQDSKDLQADLDSLQKWESDWLMEFHPEKCQVLHITNKKQPIENNYTIHGHTLESVDQGKYLGVTIHKKLEWTHHIDNITRKANNTRAFLQRNIYQCPRRTKELCYTTLVRPQLEYSSVVWDPATATNRDKIEMVQRRAARFVMGDYYRRSSVAKMLDDLKWQTLYTRRKINKAIMMYKILNNLVAVPKDDLQKATASLRGHSQRQMIPHTRTQTYQSSFFPDSIRIWNGLTEKMVSSKTLDIFKLNTNSLTFKINNPTFK